MEMAIGFYKSIRHNIESFFIAIDIPENDPAAKTAITIINYPLIFVIILLTTLYDSAKVFQNSKLVI